MNSTNKTVKVISFRPELAHHFKIINAEWIKDMYKLEGNDVKILADPQKYIIEPGGQIWFAKHSTLGIVGVCALKKVSEGYFELTKMGVLAKSRGLKIGETLLKQVLKDCKTMQIKELFLLSNKKSAAGIHLYEKNGFVHDKKIMQQYGSIYKRCDVAMRYTGNLSKLLIR